MYMESLTSDMSWYNNVSIILVIILRCYILQKISKSPNCIVLKSLTMWKGHGTIGREAAFTVIPIWGVPSELHSGRRTHFSRQVVKEISKIWPIMQHFHCVYQPRSSRLVNRTNGTIKTQLAKIMNFLFLTFASGPSIGSPQPQIHSFGKHHLSPFVIITGRPMRLKDYMIRHCLKEIHYCKGSINLLASHSKLVCKAYCSNLSSNEDQMSRNL